jgi:UDP-galactopyranose mutase
MESFDVLTVGAGFDGSVRTPQMAQRLSLRVLVIDRRPHIEGNAPDAFNAHGILCYSFGPHICHTNAPRVTDFLSHFTDWRPYEHRVVAEVDGRFVPVPINRTTVQALHGVELKDDAELAAHLSGLAEPPAALENSEDAVVAKVGRDLYES